MKRKEMKTKMKRKKKTKKIKKEFLFILILLLIGFSLRIFLTTCYYWDELIYLQHAEILSGKENNYNEFDFRPPLLSILIAGLYSLWHNPIIANIFVSLLATFSALFAYLAAKEMFNMKVAMIAAILLAFWPIHIYVSKTLLVHTTAIFFALASLFFLKKAENKNKKNNSLLFFLAGVFIAFSILTRFTYLILIPLILVNIVLFRKKYDIKKIFYGITGMLVLILPYLIWAYVNYGNAFHTFKTASLVVSWSTKQPWHFYLTNSWLLLGLGGVVGLGSWIFFKIKDKKITKEEIFLLAWFLIPLVYLSFMVHKEVRFLMVILIPTIFLSSVGFKNLFEKIRNKKVILLLFLVIILIPLFSFFYSPYIRTCDSDAQRASSWIMENTDKTGIIYAQEEFTALAYYTDRKIILAPFNKTRFFDTTADYMAYPGYYIYFEKQNKTETFPKIQELEQDSRFDLVEIIKNKERVYIYNYEPLI